MAGKDVHVSRSKAKAPVAAQAHKAILERYGLTSADLESAHTASSWRWKVATAEGRRKVKAKNGGGKKAATGGGARADKPASSTRKTTAKRGGAKKGQASAGSSAAAGAAEPRRGRGGVTVPEQIFESGGKGYLMLCGSKGRRTTQARYFRTKSEAIAQANDQAKRQAKGSVVLLEVVAAVQE